MNLPWPFSQRRAGDADGAGKSIASNASSSTSREQQADAEFAEWFKDLDENKTKTVQAPSPAIGGIAPPVTSPPETRPDYTPRQYPDGTTDIRADVMHPRSMNCRQQFDQAFYCQSLGGKFNDIYRYGQFQSCNDQWGAFWFCMRTRTLGEDEKARQTMDYYRDRDARRKREHGSSEDVWDIRERSVKRAFWKNPDEAGAEVTVKE